MHTPAVSYKRHRFPPQIIAHAVWLYFRFPLSLRLVEEMLLERGIVVSYETIRRWAKGCVATFCLPALRQETSVQFRRIAMFKARQFDQSVPARS
jgi:putative transposase